MKIRGLLVGFLWGLVTSLPVIALLSLAARGLGTAFVPFDLFDWLTRILPGRLITSSIDMMVKIVRGLHLGPTAVIAKLSEQSLALALFVFLGGILGLCVAIATGALRKAASIFGVLGGGILLGLVFAVENNLGLDRLAGGIADLWPAAVLFLLWGGLLGWLAANPGSSAQASVEERSARRRFLFLLGAGSLAAGLAALGILIYAKPRPAAVDIPENGFLGMLPQGSTQGPAASPSSQALAARFPPVQGTRPELTNADDFYRIDINTRAPKINAGTWKLEVKGLVNKPLSLSMDDLLKRPAQRQVATLSCISNPLGGDLISTGIFTGVRLKDVIAEAGLQPNVTGIFIHSVDDFYEYVPMIEVQDERTLLVYNLNDDSLPLEHGFPLRLFIPNHYGMKQPKWILRLEAVDSEKTGFWPDRGWNKQANPHTTAVIDSIKLDQIDPLTRLAPVGGIAYAGARGIRSVEIQVDDGAWEAAELRTPPLSPLSWVQWRFSWRAEPGSHTLRVRATDGAGSAQEVQMDQPHPNGATGIFSQTVEVIE